MIPCGGGLSRQRDYRLFWTGESISELADSVTIVVIPLVATGSPVMLASAAVSVAVHESVAVAAWSARWILTALIAAPGLTFLLTPMRHLRDLPRRPAEDSVRQCGWGEPPSRCRHLTRSQSLASSKRTGPHPAEHGPHENEMRSRQET